jgi:hypothetical protein
MGGGNEFLHGRLVIERDRTAVATDRFVVGCGNAFFLAAAGPQLWVSDKANSTLVPAARPCNIAVRDGGTSIMRAGH